MVIGAEVQVLYLRTYLFEECMKYNARGQLEVNEKQINVLTPQPDIFKKHVLQFLNNYFAQNMLEKPHLSAIFFSDLKTKM